MLLVLVGRGTDPSYARNLGNNLPRYSIIVQTGIGTDEGVVERN